MAIMSMRHLGDGSFCGDRSLDELEADGFREDPSVFRESDTLNGNLRLQCESFYYGCEGRNF